MSLNTGNAILSNAITVDGSYNVGIGGSPSGSYKFEINGTSRFWDGTQGLVLRAYTGGAGFGTIYSTAVTPGAGNFALAASSTATILSGVDNVSLAINSATKLYINSSGNVGIATTSPSYTFQVAKNTNDWIGGFKNYGADAYGLNIDLSGSTGLTTTYALGVYTQLSTGFFVRNNGFVGVGTTTPNQIFTIKAAGGNNGLISFQSAAGTATSYVGIGVGNGDVISSSTTADLCLRNETGNILFATNGNAEKMRITSGGSVAINNPSDKSQPLSVQGFSGNWTAFFQASTTTSNSYGPLIYAGTTSGDHAFYVASASGGTVFLRIRGDNLIFMPQLAAGTMTMSAGGYIQTSSDANFKTEAGTIDNGLDKVLRLKPRYFYWNEESGFEDKEKQLGFFAQEVNEVLGDEVASNKGENGKWGIMDRGIIAHLVSAIQELNQTIQNQQQQINQLINK